MDEAKTESHAKLDCIDDEETRKLSERYGTSADQRDMFRMGKPQQLRVGYLRPVCVSMLIMDLQ
jgi:hypothetical protein